MKHESQRAGPDDPAELLIVNGRPFGHVPQPGSNDLAAPPPTSVAVRGRHIAAVGTERQLERLRGPRTEVIDARGATVMPGFNDAHMHLRHGALALERLDLFGLSELAEVRRAISSYAAAHASEAWITGGGWLYAAFPEGLPTRQMLDDLVPDRPALLTCFDGHSGWANSRALQLAGIDRETADPPDGEIVRDARGQPTGALKERAVELLERHVPQPDDEQLLALAIRGLEALARAGVTAAQDAWATPADFALIARLAADRSMPVRLRVALELAPHMSPAQLAGTLDEFHETVRRHEQQGFLHGGIVKAFVDGVVEAQTAYMLEPYPGSDTRGDPRWTDEELRQAVAELHRRGWQVQLHAIGTAAVRQGLDAYEALGPGEAAARRHRLEHIETIDPADLPRLARLGVVASMQPLHAIPESEQADTWRSVLDPAAADSGWRIGSLLASGATLCFGSDWPVVPFDPLLGLHAAVNRQSADLRPPGGFLPAERISLEQALAAYTWGSAWAEHAEHRRGRLAEGHLADLIVLDRDLPTEGPSAILGSQVELTVVGGRIVHRRP